MQTQISTRGCELEDAPRDRLEALAVALGEREPGILLAKFLVEVRGDVCIVAAVLGLEDDSIVAQGQAGDWDAAIERLQRILEEQTSARSEAPAQG